MVAALHVHPKTCDIGATMLLMNLKVYILHTEFQQPIQVDRNDATFSESTASSQLLIPLSCDIQWESDWNNLKWNVCGVNTEMA